MERQQPQTQDRRGRFVGAARVFTVLTLVSRIFGLVRETVIAAVFGMGTVTAAFTMGFRLPNLFRRLFGEGALTSALIPVLTEYDSSPDPAQRELGLHLVQAVVTLTTILLAAVTIFIELWIMFVWLGTGGSLVEGLTALMLPYVILVCLVALGSAVLNVRGRFAEQASAPIILNVCNILAAGLIAPLISREPTTQIFVLAGSVLLAGVLQLALILRALAIRGVRLKWRVDLSHPGVRRVMFLMAPMIVPLAVVQINTYMDSVMAWFMSTDGGGQLMPGVTLPVVLGKGAAAALNWAALLYEFPLGVFSVALATAIFPALARHGAAGDTRGLADTLRRGLQIGLLISIPATAGLWLLRVEVVRTTLQYGRFTAADTPIVAETMACFAIGLAAFSASQLLVRAFYALKQVRNPVRISMLMVALNLPLNVALVLLLHHTAGLALSTTICAFLQSFWLGLLLRRQLGLMGGRRIARSLVQTLLATAAMSAAIWAIQRGLGDWPRAAIDVAGGPLAGHDYPLVAALRAANLFIPITAGAAVFFLVSRLLRNEALRDVLARDA